MFYAVQVTAASNVLRFQLHMRETTASQPSEPRSFPGSLVGKIRAAKDGGFVFLRSRIEVCLCISRSFRVRSTIHYHIQM
ncbi:hypothetical protein AFLA_010458 [Aspergillus flavus NRRL3357]|nr:hypothetical protein AFLA_010458 [Aspergillus flavus NRRL3357]